MTGNRARIGQTGAHPPGPALHRLPGVLAQLIGDRLGLMTSLTRQYGDAVRVRAVPRPLYVFNLPEHAKHVLAERSTNYHKGIGLAHARRALGDGLLTSEGELWRRQRSTIQPMFQQQRIARQASAIADEAGLLVRRLATQVDGYPVDLTEELTTLTLGVLGRTLLDADLNSGHAIGSAFEAVQDQAMFEMVTQGAVPFRLPLPIHRRFTRAYGALTRIADDLVRQDNAGPDNDGLIRRLIAARPPGTEPAALRQQLRDELITALLAGHETTASTLSWAFYLAARDRQVWERLHTEALEVFADRPPTFADLPRLTYTSAVLMEVMRLYPPVWALTRRAQGDDLVGGYHVPAGADVLICPYTLHRHPAFWSEPERFDPERFGPDATTDRPRYAYLPFGAGPRFCVGNHLGLLEAAFVLALVARDLRLTLPDGYRAVARPMLSLRVGGGLPVTVTRAR